MPTFAVFQLYLIDLVVFNANFSSISAVSGHEDIIKNIGWCIYIYIYITFFMFKHLLFAVVLAFVFVFDQIWLIINDFFVGKITIKKPVAGKCVFMNTCNGIFFQHCIEHLYFWYHNMLLQLQHTCHKLLQYFVAGNYITNWFIIPCDN